MDLREYLFRHHLTQKAFAELIGYHPIYIREIYHKRKPPGKRLISTIVQATKGEVTEEDLRK